MPPSSKLPSLITLAVGLLALYGLHRHFKAKEPQRAFFSFHYSSDIWRTNIVRKSGVTCRDPARAGFFDHSLWESAKARGDAEVRRLIDAALEDSEVTVVLIGQKTYKSRWVRYEIEKSIERNNGLLGVYIDNIRDAQGRTSRVGRSPFGEIADDVPYFDWIEDDGFSNIREWIADAPRPDDFLGKYEGDEDEDEEE